jgi:hypothetical protein
MTPKEKDFYSKVELTTEEVEEALHERRKKKWFYEKHKEYWEIAEGKNKKVWNAPTAEVVK